MITASQITDFRTASGDFTETVALKERLARIRADRCPFYLTASEFDEILRWKLRGQYGRQRSRREANTEQVIQAVTGLALSITQENKEYELELRVGILCCLRGVGIPVASAILALVYPDRYAVIDFRGWRQVFGEERTTFSIGDYKRYMQKMHTWRASWDGLFRKLTWLFGNMIEGMESPLHSQKPVSL